MANKYNKQQPVLPHTVSENPPDENFSKNASLKGKRSGFNALGFQATIEALQEEIRKLYLEDNVPWIIGYSGGKDSTATLQLVWSSIEQLPNNQRKKTIHVISTDTLVENPAVAEWVTTSLEVMEKYATEKRMPISPHRLTPRIQDSFWVNLIGKGYPAPRHKFRWCTERLKIRPSNTFINNIVTVSGEAILVLGTRKAESTRRAANMTKHEEGRVRDRLSPNSSLPGSLVYTPIEDWSNDDVWVYLMRQKNPWGIDNKDLLGLYSGASPDGECPLVVDDSTPSCGDSRFGCWVCTLVEKDKSMSAMIQNDSEKDWMLPLLDLRNALDFRTGKDSDDNESSDRHLRDFRRMSGDVQVMAGGRPIPGPYLQSARENWLRLLLKAQTIIRKQRHTGKRQIELISLEELQEIRRIWVIDKHELEDHLPKIYYEVTGVKFPKESLDDNISLGENEMNDLADICGNDRLHYELTRELLSIIIQLRSSGRRSKLSDKLEKAFSKHFYDSQEDAINRAKLHFDKKKALYDRREEAIWGSRVTEHSEDKQF